MEKKIDDIFCFLDCMSFKKIVYAIILSAVIYFSPAVVRIFLQ
jgi:hypothetical protein